MGSRVFSGRESWGAERRVGSGWGIKGCVRMFLRVRKGET